MSSFPPFSPPLLAFSTLAWYHFTLFLYGVSSVEPLWRLLLSLDPAIPFHPLLRIPFPALLEVHENCWSQEGPQSL